MFTASLKISDLDTGTPEAAARVLIACAAGDARPLMIEVADQHTGHKHYVEITDYPVDTLAALKAIMPYAQSRIEDMNETPDEYSSKATAAFEEAQRVIAEVEGQANG